MFNLPEEVYTHVTQFAQWGEVVIPHPAPVDHDVDFTNAPIIGEIIYAGAFFATQLLSWAIKETPLPCRLFGKRGAIQIP